MTPWLLMLSASSYERAFVHPGPRLVAAGPQLVEAGAHSARRRPARIVDLRPEQRFQPETEALRFLRRHIAIVTEPSRGAPLALSSRSGARERAGHDIQVFVDGQEGTTGLRIHEYLAQRGDIEVLRGRPDKRKDPAERARLR
jgi:hypothetical protein